MSEKHLNNMDSSLKKKRKKRKKKREDPLEDASRAILAFAVLSALGKSSRANPMVNNVVEQLTERIRSELASFDTKLRDEIKYWVEEFINCYSDAKCVDKVCDKIKEILKVDRKA